MGLVGPGSGKGLVLVSRLPLQPGSRESQRQRASDTGTCEAYARTHTHMLTHGTSMTRSQIAICCEPWGGEGRRPLCGQGVGVIGGEPLPPRSCLTPGALFSSSAAGAAG